MFSEVTVEWMIQMLSGSPEHNSFVEMLGLGALDPKRIVEELGRGMRGNPRMHKKAGQYLKQKEELYALNVDHDILTSIGIDTVFATALLYSYGPYGFRTDWFEDPDDDVLRGPLVFFLDGKKQEAHWISMLRTEREANWELQISIAITDEMRWKTRTDEREAVDWEGPNFLLEEGMIPDTIKQIIKGTKFKNFLSHPILDQYDLGIEDVTEQGGEIRIDINNHGKSIRVIDLIKKEGHMEFGTWFYRPEEHDDWGTVRDQNRCIIGQIRDPANIGAESLDAHRSSGKDPWESYARLAAAAPHLLRALEKLLPKLDELERHGHEVDPDDLNYAKRAVKIARGEDSNSDDYPFKNQDEN